MLTTKNLIILLPHQDDEIAILPLLDEIQNSINLKIIYLTTNKNEKLNQKRNNESLNVLKKIGIKKNDIFFLNNKHRIYDKNLYKKSNEVIKYLLSKKNLITLDRDSTILTTSFEGGHPDHDASFFICMKIYKKLKYKKFMSFPLYNSEKKLMPFQAFKNIMKYNDQLIFIETSLAKSFFYLKLIFTYKSQMKTILSLFPFYLYRCLIKQSFILIDHSYNENFISKPHQGKLFYEKRKWMAFESFKKSTF